MQYSIVEFEKVLANENLRLEAEFWAQSNAVLKKYILGKDIIEFVQYGTSEELNEKNLGFPILRLNEFDSFFISKPAKSCNKITFETYNNLKLKKGDVLICRTNGNPNFVGKSAIVLEDSNYAFASYLFRIRPKHNFINSATLMIYLNSKMGRQEIDKNSMISNQANFSPAKFREILIPQMAISIQNLIEKSVLKSYELKNISQNLYIQAEELLLRELRLLNWKAEHKLFFIKNSDDVKEADRIDAEYFQPKYDEIINAIRNYSNGFDFIGNQFKQNKKIFIIDNKKIYNYVEIGSINVSSLEITPKNILGIELPANARIKLSKNDVLISKVRTYRGAVAIVNSNDFIGSGAFTVLKENGKINNETLTIFLKLKPILDLTLKYNSGTSYPTIFDNDILNIPIPIFIYEIQKQIKEKIQESFKCREQSKQLLEIAKIGVEIAIKQNESTAIDWINQELGKIGVGL